MGAERSWELIESQHNARLVIIKACAVADRTFTAQNRGSLNILAWMAFFCTWRNEARLLMRKRKSLDV